MPPSLTDSKKLLVLTVFQDVEDSTRGGEGKLLGGGNDATNLVSAMGEHAANLTRATTPQSFKNILALQSLIDKGVGDCASEIKGVLVYYSGHGYLSSEQEALPMDKIDFGILKDEFQINHPALIFFAIQDCCRVCHDETVRSRCKLCWNNAKALGLVAGDEPDDGGGMGDTTPGSVSPEDQEEDQEANWAIIYSCAPHQRSLEMREAGYAYGRFTEELIKILRGDVAISSERYLTPRIVCDYMKGKVGVQTPEFEGNGDLKLIPNPNRSPRYPPVKCGERAVVVHWEDAKGNGQRTGGVILDENRILTIAHDGTPKKVVHRDRNYEVQAPFERQEENGERPPLMVLDLKEKLGQLPASALVIFGGRPSNQRVIRYELLADALHPQSQGEKMVNGPRPGAPVIVNDALWAITDLDGEDLKIAPVLKKFPSLVAELWRAAWQQLLKEIKTHLGLEEEKELNDCAVGLCLDTVSNLETLFHERKNDQARLGGLKTFVKCVMGPLIQMTFERMDQEGDRPSGDATLISEPLLIGTGWSKTNSQPFEVQPAGQDAGGNDTVRSVLDLSQAAFFRGSASSPTTPPPDPEGEDQSNLEHRLAAEKGDDGQDRAVDDVMGRQGYFAIVPRKLPEVPAWLMEGRLPSLSLVFPGDRVQGESELSKILNRILTYDPETSSQQR